MNARRFVLWMISVFFCLSLPAQTRMVKGQVTDESGAPMSGVKITAETGENSQSGSDGRFSLQVSFRCQSLTLSYPYFFDASAEVDGSYLLIMMKYDKDAKAREEQEARRKAEEQAREEQRARKAEAQAREKAVKDSLAALEKVRLDAERAEKARLAAEEKARKEEEARLLAVASAKAKAEQEAQLAAERAEKQRLASEEKAKRIAKTKELDANYNGKYSNKGIESTISLSYSYPMSTGDLVYVISGYRNYGTLHPVELDYTFSYKFNRIVSVGAGVGVLYHLKSLEIINDQFLPLYGDFKEKRLDVLVFANVKLRFLRTAIRPLISVQGGLYCLSNVWYADAGVGCEFRMGKSMALSVQASFRTCPWPSFRKGERRAFYEPSYAPCLKVEMSF